MHADADLERYMREAVKVSNDSPVLLDRFLDNAVEVDIDVIADAQGNVLVGGVMQHIEPACIRRFLVLAAAVFAVGGNQARLREQVVQLAKALDVIGLMNTQFAVQTNAQGEEPSSAGSESARLAHGAVRVKAISQPL
ncbi:hypothetical protein [Thermomonas sp.]|uniref:ATP-binding protein n=1 Tax=Thermomonas sp. TaxID=1971895 RepID=UPI0025D51D3A|nr:hypothetical protein [Thermomonas sp.]